MMQKNYHFHAWLAIQANGGLLLHYRQQGADLAPAIILLHGLFGDKENLGALARALAGEFRVIQVDLPNHGDSPHQADMAYPGMCDELLYLLDTLGLGKVHLLGHSLGGKLAMQFALRHPLRVNRLIVVDMAPVTYAPRHESVFAALQAVVDCGCQSRQDAEAAMTKALADPRVRQFLLKSFRAGGGWHFNLPALKANYLMLMSWPSPESSFAGPSLFIKGGQSDYLLPEHQSLVSHYFPDAKARIIPDAGHWLHAEKPLLFNRLVVDFLSTSR